MLENSEGFVIISKDRTLIVKGRGGADKTLVRVADKKDKKPILVYSSQGKAQQGFDGYIKDSEFTFDLPGYRNMTDAEQRKVHEDLYNSLEIVKVSVKIEIV